MCSDSESESCFCDDLSDDVLQSVVYAPKMLLRFHIKPFHGAFNLFSVVQRRPQRSYSKEPKNGKVIVSSFMWAEMELVVRWMENNSLFS
jgi:hypothetical protein